MSKLVFPLIIASMLLGSTWSMASTTKELLRDSAYLYPTEYYANVLFFKKKIHDAQRVLATELPSSTKTKILTQMITDAKNFKNVRKSPFSNEFNFRLDRFQDLVTKRKFLTLEDELISLKEDLSWIP